ncbi:hypothetical protein WH50_09515 [Pokkaliibacter plantistimulans]|uniref:Lipoprotein n=1 Tax=Pokkaliibacter plantistimulans TaxID=1635171 RepID=A0ABX5LYZ1_9GAMM|nr:hypothetical protein [Pokkaliibacter plantistimulans]PXF31531.1 hypothetical protein WH50_09515 [Pokkaliibacter plantistimulans]
MIKKLVCLALALGVSGCDLKPQSLLGSSSSGEAAPQSTDGNLQPRINQDDFINHAVDAVVPLKVGNSWSYVVNGDPARLVSSKVEKIQMLNGQPWYYYDVLGTGHWVRGNADGSLDEAVDFYQAPALTEATPRVEQNLVSPNGQQRDYQNEGGWINYQHCKLPLRVPAGVFDCDMYTFKTGINEKRIEFYAKGVGLVKVEIQRLQGIETYALQQYQVK